MEWSKFKSEAELKINANQKSIDEFKLKIKSDSKGLKNKYEKDIVKLEQKNTELKKQLNEYKNDGKVKWEEFKLGFNSDMDSVGQKIKKLFTNKD